MAKAVRFHIGSNGPDICRADPSNPNAKGCPFGGSSGDENHFATMGEAETAYERRMEAEGNGLVASRTRVAPKVSIPVKPSVQRLTASLHTAFRSKFDELVADRSFGVSRDPKLGYIADGSEGLERLRSSFVRKSGYELDPHVEYADDDREVIEHIEIRELGITIGNQNVKADLDEVASYRSMAADDHGSYWD